MNPQSGGMEMPAKKHNSTLIIAVLALLLVVALAFGIWAMSQAMSNKSDSDKKVAAAVAATAKSEDAKITQQFQTQLQLPTRAYNGSVASGSISFSYPKNYSAYVDETDSSQPLDAYFQPNQVPGISGNSNYALRAELVTDSYNNVLDGYSSDIQDGTLKAAAYVPAKMAGVKNVQAGTLLTGTLDQDSQRNNQNGAMLVIAVRDKTLKIYTESNDFLSDFNNIVLPSLTFSP